MKTSRLLTVVLLICLSLTLIFALSSCSNENATTEIASVTIKKDKQNVILKGTLDSVYAENHSGEKLYVLALPTADTSFIPADVDVVGEVKVKSNVKLSFSLTDGNGFSRLAKAFVIAEKTDFSYAPITNAMYIQNPEMLADKKSDAPEVSDIKGICGEDVYDAYLAGAGRMLFNVDMSAFMLNDHAVDAIKFNKDGISYFFDGARVAELDSKIKSANELGMRVYLRTGFFADLNATSSRLVEDNYSDVPDLSDENVARMVNAFYSFLAERYSGEYGQVSDYIIGQDGNRVWLDSETAQEAGYQAWVRAAHLSLRSVDSNARVYVSVSNKWRNSGDKTIGAKSFLAHFAEQAKLCGDYDWSLALDLGRGDDLPSLLATDAYDYSNIGVDNMGEVVDLLNTADMRYNSEKRDFIIDALALSETMNESNRATYYICAYYKAAEMGAKAFFYTDTKASLLDKSDNKNALYYMFMLCGTNKTEQLTEYTRKVDGFTNEDMQKHVFKSLTFLQNAKFEISDDDAKRNSAFPVSFAEFKENDITRAQLTLIKISNGSYDRHLDVYALTGKGVGAVSAYEISAKEIMKAKYLGVTASSENEPTLILAITTSDGKTAYAAQAKLVNGESECFFDLSDIARNVNEADKLTVSLCLVSDDEISAATFTDMTLYGKSGMGGETVIIIVVVAVVAIGLIAAIVALAAKRKKKQKQD